MRTSGETGGLLVGTIVTVSISSVDFPRFLGQAGQLFMRTPESGPETDAPFLQSDLVIVGQHYLAFLGPQDDTLLATNLQQDKMSVSSSGV